MNGAVDLSRYAIGGRMPRSAVRPTSRDEVAEVLAAAARDGQAVVPWGGGVALAAEPAPARYDLALDVSGLDRIVEHNPDDLTLTAECGATIGALRALLATHGQELPLEAARADRATLGGVLAANASGPRRQRLGSPRDRILGARFALADGTSARSGGKVVKNVAGYGIHRLLCGSRGGLGVILEASLKLLPAPEHRVALIHGAGAGALGETARWVFLPRLEPSFVTVVSDALVTDLGLEIAGEHVVIVGLEDDRAWVAEQEAAVTRALGPPRARIEGDEVVRLASRLADLEEREPARATFTTRGNHPAALAPLLANGANGGFVFHASAGRLHRFGAGVPSLDGFTAIDARGSELPSPSTASGVTALRTRIRAALDPANVLALGDRWLRAAG